MSRALVFIFPLLVSSLSAQNSIRWKTWADAPRTRANDPAPQRRNPLVRHAVLEFASAPAPWDLDRLRQRGANVVGRLSDRAIVARLPDNFTADDLTVTWVGTLAAGDKISPLLRTRARQREPVYFVVEFYPDVEPSEARSIAAAAGVRIVENPDLTANNLLVQATAQQLRELANWDEVEYVFPASADLVRGVALRACAGALTSEGLVSQGVPAIGEGWDGPGLASAQLGYAFAALPDNLPSEDASSEIVRAFNEWARYASLQFNPASSTAAPRTLSVLFGRGPHGDPYPFDGPGKTIAHTYYPYPLNPEPIAGDLHFDADEPWRIGANTDVFSVALHEAGHALGLGHSDNPADVMYPYYRRVTELAAGDIAGILKLYAARDEPPVEPTPAPQAPLSIVIAQPPERVTAASIVLSGTVTGGQGEVQLGWQNGALSGTVRGSRTWTAGVSLLLGPNVIVIAARDERGNTAGATVTIERQAAASTSIRISQPSASGAYRSELATVTISGSASDPAGIGQVTWITSRGNGGQATGTTTWSTPPLTLPAGETVVTVTVHGNAGGTAAQSIAITYAAPPANENDTTAPSIAILSPAGTNVSTSASSVVFRGTAADTFGVASVTWSSSGGGSGFAAGTTSWTTPPIPLLVGANWITIRAADPSGNTGWRSVMVTRSL